MRELFLGEIMERDNVEYGLSNLVISPTGSGKTYFMVEDLIERYGGNVLILASTSSLKRMMGTLDDVYGTKDLKYDEKGNPIGHHLMTYAEFGRKMLFVDRDESLLSNYDLILADEVHSLFDYFMSHGNPAHLAIAIEHLFKNYFDKRIFYFTATTDKIETFINIYGSEMFKRTKIFDYSKDESIKKYSKGYVQKFTNLSEMEDLLGNLGDIGVDLEELRTFVIGEHKALIYNERIDGMGRIMETLRKLGFRVKPIWSENNEKHPMNEEQLEIQRGFTEDGMFPDNYDFVIMNGAMREGWNLVDDRVQYFFVNTTDETSAVQFLGRARFDITFAAVRIKAEVTSIEMKIMDRARILGILDRLENRELFTEDKNEIVNELNVIRDNGNQVKWPAISKALVASGYKVENKSRRVNGKLARFSIISRYGSDDKKSEQIELEQSSGTPKQTRGTTSRKSAVEYSELTRFISDLDKNGFTEKYERILDNYMSKGRGVAFNHIKGSYRTFILHGDWSEDKFYEITGLIADKGDLFSKANYRKYEDNYRTEEDIEKEEEDLLAYIASNGG